MSKGFIIKCKNKEECFKELKEFAEEHPDYWIYYCDNIGFKMDKPVPVTRYMIEVNFFSNDVPHPSTMMFHSLYQKGTTPAKERTEEMMIKQMTFFAMLGGSYINE